MQKWEYGTCRVWSSYVLSSTFPPGQTEHFAEVKDSRKIQGRELDMLTHFNKLGEEGWELVTLSPVIIVENSSVALYPSTMRAVFKRPKSG